MKKAFTITELLVAMVLLAVVLGASGLVFHYSIDVQRTASATSEIMRNLRAITDQLNADFVGLCKEAPLYGYFDISPSSSEQVRADRIVFFATGDFRSIRQYNGKTVVGNVARIFYGQSAEVTDVCPNPYSVLKENRKEKILVRKQIILTSDPDLLDLNPDPNNDPSEYITSSLAEQITTYVSDWAKARNDWIVRPAIDPNNEEDIPMFLARGVDDFTIQFDANDTDRFDPNGTLVWLPENNDMNDVDNSRAPNAIKFTFTLYDSKGIIKGGRKFTHIVYIGK